jgi:hypothetical protein
MNEKLYDLIEDYTLGRLTAPQLEEFEAAMATDTKLAAAVYEHRTEWEMRELLAENVLRGQIRHAFAEQPAAGRAWWLKNRIWVLLAALLLGVAGFLLYQNMPAPPPASPETIPNSTLPNQTPPPGDAPASQPVVPEKNEMPAPPDPRKYAMAAYEVPESVSNLRGPSDDDTLGLASKAFTEKNYRRTLQLLSVLPADERQEALLLRAHAQFATGRYAAAARDFSDLEAGGVYRREAQWFGLLARMSTPGSDRKVWMRQLDVIRRETAHPYRQQAEQLYKDVNQ